MRKLFLLLAIVLVSAPASLAQDYSNWEFFIGYAHERANNGADRLDAQGRRDNCGRRHRAVDFPSKRVQYNGVTGEVVANVHRNVGLVGNVSATFHNANFRDSLSGQTLMPDYRGIPCCLARAYNFRNARRSIPFAHALFGATRYNADFETTISLVPTQTKRPLRWRSEPAWTSRRAIASTSDRFKLTIFRYFSTTGAKTAFDSQRA